MDEVLATVETWDEGVEVLGVTDAIQAGSEKVDRADGGRVVDETCV